MYRKHNGECVYWCKSAKGKRNVCNLKQANILTSGKVIDLLLGGSSITFLRLAATESETLIINKIHCQHSWGENHPQTVNRVKMQLNFEPVGT